MNKYNICIHDHKTTLLNGCDGNGTVGLYSPLVSLLYIMVSSYFLQYCVCLFLSFEFRVLRSGDVVGLVEGDAFYFYDKILPEST